ncbi:hypothetical protein BDZ94DRAFT_1310365 [Collybia nuda]|uniref:Uncharacterized protein n=1 Tax=Collybia nuda TaxID=64659 RepID=A0A9P6CDF4_9AGAR|nr:hypothetical protein BDZ94DRAFT_1310365 [Collybia nuda]
MLEGAKRAAKKSAQGLMHSINEFSISGEIVSSKPTQVEERAQYKRPVRISIRRMNLKIDSPGDTGPPQNVLYWSKFNMGPIYELPFDIFSEENQLSLESISQVEHMMKFGRPLFYAMYKGGNTNIVTLAVQKLNRQPFNQTLNDQLAASFIRLLLEFEPLVEVARHTEMELIAGHMRVAYSMPKHRLYIYSGAPSESVLAEASACIMKKVKGDFITQVNTFLERGTISKGEWGELVGRLLLTLIHDKAISAEYTGYIRLLIRQKIKSKPANVIGGQTLEEVFTDARINFTHFVKARDTNIVSDQASWMVFIRCMAFACAVLLRDEKINQWAVTGIFVRFRDQSTPERVTTDSTELCFFTQAHPGDENDELYNTRPYITIAIKPKASELFEGNRPTPMTASTVPAGFADLEVTSHKSSHQAGKVGT